MKKIILLLTISACIFFKSEVKAQHGFVGIGVSAPTNSLHVKPEINLDPVKIEGLKTGANTDKIVVATSTGVLRTVAASTLTTTTTNIVKKKIAYTVDADGVVDNIILCNTDSAGFTLTLPTAASSTGRTLVIRKTDETSNVLTFSIAIKVSETTSITTMNANATMRIQSDGTAWWKID